MKFHPIKYKQPTDGGDARCALYALCNLFDDGGFLLYNNVGESTYHNKEVEILRHYSEISESVKRFGIKDIYPHAITPIGTQLVCDEDFDICQETGRYVPVLLDIMTDDSGVYHTVLALWGKEDCVVLDSKKDFPEEMYWNQIWCRCIPKGFRILTGDEPDKNGEMPLIHFSKDQLPHIFNTTES